MATLIVLPTGINQAGSLAAVAPAIETNLISYTVPAGKNFYIVNVSGNGTAKAYFRLRVNGTLQAQREMDVSDRNIDMNFSDSFGLKTVAGDLVVVSVYNLSTVAGDYTANMSGGFQ